MTAGEAAARAVQVVGFDACGKAGWVGVLLADGRYAGSLVGADLAELLGRVPRARTVGVDMPLGLIERGWRQADLAARELLGARRSSVFMVAPSAAWQEDDHPAASRVCRELTGGGLSRQAWALRAKLRQARECWTREPERLFEVHPELSFRALAGGSVPAWPKKSWRGQMLRRTLLAEAGVTLPDSLGEADRVPADDVLDAAAAAWSAHRIALGSGVRLPAEPQRDSGGRPVEIRY